MCNQIIILTAVQFPHSCKCALRFICPHRFLSSWSFIWRQPFFVQKDKEIYLQSKCSFCLSRPMQMGEGARIFASSRIVGNHKFFAFRQESAAQRLYNSKRKKSSLRESKVRWILHIQRRLQLARRIPREFSPDRSVPEIWTLGWSNYSSPPKCTHAMLKGAWFGEKRPWGGLPSCQATKSLVPSSARRRKLENIYIYA